MAPLTFVHIRLNVGPGVASQLKILLTSNRSRLSITCLYSRDSKGVLQFGYPQATRTYHNKKITLDIAVLLTGL
jgi:hypothetical protein